MLAMSMALQCLHVTLRHGPEGQHAVVPAAEAVLACLLLATSFFFIQQLILSWTTPDRMVHHGFVLMDADSVTEMRMEHERRTVAKCS